MITRQILLLVMPFLLAALIGCSSEAVDTVERDGEPPIINVDSDDPQMEAAIQNARSTVDQFITAFSNPQPSQADFALKLPVTDGDHTEHLWVLPSRYESGTFRGTINNEPFQVKTVKLGDEVDFDKGDISDWKYVEDGKLVGGYTIRVLRDRMSDEDRAALDNSVPFTFE